MEDRIKKIYEIIDSSNLDAIALVPGSNFRYVTGGNFHLMERPTVLIITRNKEVVAILPSLEVNSFNKLGINAKIISWHDKDGFQKAFVEAQNIIGKIDTLGVEGQRIRFFETQAIKESFKSIKLITFSYNTNHLINKTCATFVTWINFNSFIF